MAGHRGMVGSAVVRCLREQGYEQLILRDRSQLDLRNPAKVDAFFESEKPEYVFLSAARVGGIWANANHPAEFIYENLAIAINVIHSAHRFGVKKLLNLGSSCIYPRDAPQPLKEEYLLTGLLEPTNEPYAIAKIAAIKLCEAYRRQYGCDFVSLMPTNLYGPGDNFDLQTSHVLPALIRKFFEAAKEGRGSVEVWGTGSPRREFLFVDDLAEACVFVMNRYSGESFLNVGWGEDVSIAELARLVADVVGFGGKIEFDTAQPDGTPRKLLDVGKLTALGWRPKVVLRDGVRKTLETFLEQGSK